MTSPVGTYDSRTSPVYDETGRGHSRPDGRGDHYHEMTVINTEYNGTQIGGGDEVHVDVAEDMSRPSTSRSLRRRRRGTQSSYDSEVERDLLRRLPSQKLGSSNNQRKKSSKKRSGHHTLRLRHGIPVDPDEVVENLLNDPDQVDGGPTTQVDNIRDLTTTITNKKLIRDQVDQGRQERRDRHPGCAKLIRYNISLGWTRFKYKFAEVRYSLRFWHGWLKKIEGHFGTGVASYFRFLRWLLALNLVMMILLFAFITVPQIMYRWLDQDPIGYHDNEPFSGTDLLTGGGWFDNTELYYKYHHNGVIKAISGTKYDMRYAYLFTDGAFYIATLILLGYKLSQAYRQYYIENSGGIHSFYCSKIFCGWDFGISSNDAADLKHKSISKELQEYLAGFHKEEGDKGWSARCSLLWFRLATNLVVMCLLAGSGYLVWYISSTQSFKTDEPLIDELALPLCISGINFIIPFAFSILANFEAYVNPRNEVVITMFRTITLNVVTLGVLVGVWFRSVDCKKRLKDSSWLDRDIECEPCWENFIGQEIYKLVVVDFVFILFVTFFAEFVRMLIARFCIPHLGYPEFDIARNTLNLIYSQLLIWLGTFFSPLLSCIMIIKLFIIFYVKSTSVLQNCVPSTKPWRAGFTETVILGLLSVVFILCFIAVGYSAIDLSPSDTCGPFQGQNSTFTIVTDLLDKWEASDNAQFVKLIVQFISSNAFFIGLFVLLCVIAHFSRIKSNGYEKMSKMLKNQISLEGKDKMFLLQLLQDASRTAVRRQHLEPTTEPLSPTNNAKNFAKQATGFDRRMMSPRGVHPTGSPQHQNLSTPSSSPSHQDYLTPQMYNQGYADRSFESGASRELSVNPTVHNDYNHSPAAANPVYSDRSPTSRPNLPYPGSQYNTYNPDRM